MGELYRTALATTRGSAGGAWLAFGVWLSSAAPASAQQPPSSGGAAPPAGSAAGAEAAPAGYETFISDNAAWLIAVIVVAILVVVGWALRGSGRRAEKAAVAVRRPERETQQAKRYSSTRIQVADVDDRLGTKVEETEIETEREYALVVDEAALQTTEDVDTRTGTEYVDDSSIVDLLSEEKFDEAYAEYDGRLREDGSQEFHRGVEERLGNHFLAARDLEKAARVFEHYVTTHPPADVRPEVYFNLGYIHFHLQSARKSRRFLKLFLENSDNPRHIERAQRILAQLDSGEP